MESSGASAGRTAWARNLGAPVRAFLGAETAGAVVLAAAALAALIWANSPWPDSYEELWRTDLEVSLGEHVLSSDLRGWVNQGLMTMFFLVLGLEARREFDLGELRERTRVAVPVTAAIGGMAVAAGSFLVLNAGGAGVDAWGVAMSTDTALALGVLAVVAPRGATRLRVFLLTMVVVDDFVALLVIAIAYSDAISFVPLAIAVALFCLLFVIRQAGSWRTPLAVIVGAGVWLATRAAGIDPVVTGLAIGLVTSAYRPAREDLERATDLARAFREQPTPELAREAQLGVTSTISPNERLQFRLHPWTSFAIVPLFALANAGIHLDGDLLGDALGSTVTLGIVLGYLVGKPVGILGAAWLASRRALGGAKLTITWPGLAGTAWAAGIGFTLSLLIADKALSGDLLAQAKVGILATAILAPALAFLVFRLIGMLPAGLRARQLGKTAEQLIDLSDDVDPERDHIRGKRDATVTLVEYGDFECPYCGQAEPAIRELLSREGDDLRYVFRHLPLADVHTHAQLAAEASEAAGAQGEFWAMHDRLLEHQDELNLRDLHRYAGELGLDLDRFDDDLRERRHAAHIAEDVQSADASGVSGTPTFFVNGRRHHGVYDVETLAREVKAARARARVEAVATRT